MKLTRLRRLRELRNASRSLQKHAGAQLGADMQSLPTLVAAAFGRLRIAQRVRLLRRLLLPVGPMALVVLGGGVFAKYVGEARWSRMSVSVEDAAVISSGQVYELVRYVEQSNPLVLQEVLLDLARDSTTMAALGVTIAAIVLRHVARGKGARGLPLTR